MELKENNIEFLKKRVETLEKVLKSKNDEIDALKDFLNDLRNRISRINLYATRHEKDLVPFFAARKVLKLFKEL